MTRKIVSTLSVAALLSAGAVAQTAATNAAPSTSTNSVIAGPNKLAIINIQAAIANTNEGQRDLDAKQSGYAVVIDVSSQQSPVLWAAPSVDITKPVIDAYNVVSGVAAPAAKPATSAPSASTTIPRRTTPPPAAPKPAATSPMTPK